MVIVLVIVPLYLLSNFFLEEDLKKTESEINAVLKEGANINKIEASMLQLHSALATKLSLQILALGLFLLMCALFVMWRIAKSITNPLETLVKETKKVASGKYEEVVFPKISGRDNEIALLGSSFESMVEGLKEREKIRSVLNKVVSRDVAEEILKSNIHLGGEDRVVTILFCDIRNFTSITEHYTPQETISMLNEFMTKMTRVIEGEGGVIDKYIGDEIMALYGAPVTYEDHAIRALSSAKIMIELLKQWNIKRRQKNEPELNVGIGIHTGLVVAGNMGAEDRLNYTVLGTSVNLASRLCQAAKPGQILISEYTLKQSHIEDSFLVKELTPLVIKGFTDPVSIYEILGFKWS